MKERIENQLNNYLESLLTKETITYEEFLLLKNKKKELEIEEENIDKEKQLIHLKEILKENTDTDKEIIDSMTSDQIMTFLMTNIFANNFGGLGILNNHKCKCENDTTENVGE